MGQIGRRRATATDSTKETMRRLCGVTVTAKCNNSRVFMILDSAVCVVSAVANAYCHYVLCAVLPIHWTAEGDSR